MAAEPDDLADWIAELRSRVARGELDGLGHFAVLGRLYIGLAAIGRPCVARGGGRRKA